MTSVTMTVKFTPAEIEAMGGLTSGKLVIEQVNKALNVYGTSLNDDGGITTDGSTGKKVSAVSASVIDEEKGTIEVRFLVVTGTYATDTVVYNFYFDKDTISGTPGKVVKFDTTGVTFSSGT